MNPVLHPGTVTSATHTYPTNPPKRDREGNFLFVQAASVVRQSPRRPAASTQIGFFSGRILRHDANSSHTVL